MEYAPNYRAEDFTATLPAADYIARYRDAERFLACCRACGNYGRSWACPPFDEDPEPTLRRYRSVLLVATKITPAEEGIPLEEAHRMIRPERLRLERRLRELEHRCGGRSYAYAGRCLHCPEGTCARIAGGPCRHPDLLRPSLEAVGFDLGRTASELLGIELRWSHDGKIPEYLTLVCGLFHNADEVRWTER